MAKKGKFDFQNKARKGSLTSREKALFQAILDAIRDHGAENVALVRSEFDHKPCAVMAAILPGEDGGADVMPFAMMLRPEDFDRLTDPTEAA